MPTYDTHQPSIVRRLNSDGWVLARHGANHDVYTHPAKKGVASFRVIAPYPPVSRKA